MASFNITKAKAKERVKINGPNHGQNKIHKIANKESRSTIGGLGKKHSIVAPLAYVLRERDRKLNERLMANNHNYIAPPEDTAKVVIINNSPKDLQKLTLVPKGSVCIFYNIGRNFRLSRAVFLNRNWFHL